MREVTLEHEIHTDEDTFWSSIVFDEGFNKKLFIEALRLPEWRLISSTETPTSIVRRVHVTPSTGDLPGPVKKVIGERLSYTEEGTFDKATRRYAFSVTPSTLADKTTIKGELWAKPIGEKKIVRMCRMTVEVRVFMVGGMVEDRILADLRASYDQSTTFTNEFLRQASS